MIRSQRPFLLWALFASTLAVAAYAAWTMGALTLALTEPSHLSRVNLVLFVCTTLYAGYQFLQVGRRSAQGLPQRPAFVAAGHIKFIATQSFVIAIAGTVTCLIITYTAKVPPNMSIAEQGARIMHDGAMGFVNTLVGAVCAGLLELQDHALKTFAARADEIAGAQQ